ncbi:ARPP-2 domain-containing protein [Acaryochloris sp. CCMEE 5410]|uniref:ARPP-2 domain-containing protein n=1 Tax=Acaryochloris sp. CCMEE 5410 TaxID=310037 RepID=UPI0002FEED6F|nr:hypothetical protein [Acaryochloris sp. CCMEE 5410]KAI9133994.1 hypothetical protein ON05_012355 [Acaryochloris sp. CCMEE 5410]
MAPKAPLLSTLSLKGIEIAPSQVWGAIRIVPLLRRNVRGDLRLAKRDYNEDLTVVSLSDKTAYTSYVPHGLVLSWNEEGQPVAAKGSQFGADGKRFHARPASVRVLSRMAKREARNQLRFLPMHLAMEGFLSLFFSGPDIAWSEYSKQALSQGLSPRTEWSFSGQAIQGLADALRVFEIHQHQVGMLMFVSEALASAFVTPTPEDYRLLHPSLLQDFYGELLYQYGIYGGTVPMQSQVDESKVETLADLQDAIATLRQDWADFQGLMASDLLQRPVESKRIYTAGPFTLQRFITDLQLKSENHIGEAIVRQDGQLEYLKTYRLSAGQARRAYLLSQLAAQGWNIERTALSMNESLENFIYRLEKAGFGYLINNQVREQARKVRRRD